MEGGRKAAHRQRKGKRETLENYGGTRAGYLEASWWASRAWLLGSEEVTFFFKEFRIKVRGSGLPISQEPFLCSFADQALDCFLVVWLRLCPSDD